jgi:hypothetical protein
MAPLNNLILILNFLGRSAQIPAKSEKVIVRPEERKDMFTDTPIFVD